MKCMLLQVVQVMLHPRILSEFSDLGVADPLPECRRERELGLDSCETG